MREMREMRVIKRKLEYRALAPTSVHSRADRISAFLESVSRNRCGKQRKTHGVNYAGSSGF